ncbi:MAG: S49 family peptidase [Betaproteobacteria bacterium]|nr:S49 family peptidase [Betaproteobacteria bacterium]
MRHATLISEIGSRPWALQIEWLQAMTVALQQLAEGKTSRFGAEVAGRFSAGRPREAFGSAGDVAIVPVMGIITQRGSAFDELFGGGSVAAEPLTAVIRQLGADESIKGIVLDIDSPGGTVGGLGELGDAIYSLRGVKPVVAIANALCASAAYWIGSAAEQFVVSPEGQAGSIGVWAAHVDTSGLMEKMGVKYTLVSAGKYKTEGNPYAPLDESARAHLQAQVDDYHGMFVRAVARNRKDTQIAVREGYGQGRVLNARDAVRAKLADRVAPLSQVVEELRGRGTLARQRAGVFAGLSAGRPRLEAARRRLLIETA